MAEEGKFAERMKMQQLEMQVEQAEQNMSMLKNVFRELLIDLDDENWDSIIETIEGFRGKV